MVGHVVDVLSLILQSWVRPEISPSLEGATAVVRTLVDKDCWSLDLTKTSNHRSNAFESALVT